MRAFTSRAARGPTTSRGSAATMKCCGPWNAPAPYFPRSSSTRFRPAMRATAAPSFTCWPPRPRATATGARASGPTTDASLPSGRSGSRKAWTSGCPFHLEDHLAHGARGQAFEGPGQLIEGKNAVDQRSRAAVREQCQHLLPAGTAFGIGVRTHRNAAHANAPEEQRGRVERWDRTGQASDQAHLPRVAQSLDHVGQERAADVVDGQVDVTRVESLL